MSELEVKPNNTDLALKALQSATDTPERSRPDAVAIAMMLAARGPDAVHSYSMALRKMPTHLLDVHIDAMYTDQNMGKLRALDMYYVPEYQAVPVKDSTGNILRDSDGHIVFTRELVKHQFQDLIDEIARPLTRS